MTIRPALFDRWPLTASLLRLTRLPYWLVFDRTGWALPATLIARASELDEFLTYAESRGIDGEAIVTSREYRQHASWGRYVAGCYAEAVAQLTAPELRKPDDWAHEFDWVVVHPDGWRKDNTAWDTLITREEYALRGAESTCLARKEPLSVSQSCTVCSRQTHLEDEFDRVCGDQLGPEQFCDGIFVFQETR